MDDIRRIRPQSKRKALNAKAFVLRYIEAANEAREAGRLDEAQELTRKVAYWVERWNRHNAAYLRGQRHV